MEASRKERWILYGAVPIIAAIVGAVATVIVGRLTGGSGNMNETMLSIVKDTSLTADQKARLMTLANENTRSFYSWLSSIGGLMAILIGMLAPALAARIRER